MSFQDPPAAGGPVPEYLGDEPIPSTRRRRPVRRTLVAVGCALGLVAGGLGAWGVARLVGGGPQPAVAVPADAVGYLALDLDPSAGQKVEALRTLRKFPAVAEHLDIDDPDELKRWLFERISAESGCDTLDFDRDVEPWLGDRLAIAAVPAAAGEWPEPFGVVQVDDEAGARDGLTRLAECGGTGEVGVAFVGEYAVIAEHQDSADRIATDAQAGSLADAAAYRDMVASLGDSGVLTGYVAPDAPRLLADAFGELALGGATNGIPPEVGDPSAQVEEQFKDFRGAAGVVRFRDGAVEVQVAAAGLPETSTPIGDGGIGDLPASTLLALGLPGGKGLMSGLPGLRLSAEPDSEAGRQFAEEFERASGITPEELQRLLGGGFSLAVSTQVDLAGLFSGGPEGTLPVGIRIQGDPASIRPLVEDVVSAAGDEVALHVAEGDGVVAVALDAAYAEELAGDGDLLRRRCGGLDAGGRRGADDRGRTGGLGEPRDRLPRRRQRVARR